jgi:hypothetical protein
MYVKIYRVQNSFLFNYSCLRDCDTSEVVLFRSRRRAQLSKTMASRLLPRSFRTISSNNVAQAILRSEPAAAEGKAGWEVAVRKVLPKDEYIVLAIFGFWGGTITGLRAAFGGKKEEAPAA